MTINLEIKESQENIDLDFGFDAVYTGSYELEPEVNGYTIDTANKRMLKDLKIKDIRTSDVDNAQGGRTFTIS